MYNLNNSPKNTGSSKYIILQEAMNTTCLAPVCGIITGISLLRTRYDKRSKAIIQWLEIPLVRWPATTGLVTGQETLLLAVAWYDLIRGENSQTEVRSDKTEAVL